MSVALCGCCKNAMDAAEHNGMLGGFGREQYKEPKWPLAILAQAPRASKPPPGFPCLRPHPPSQAQAQERIPSQVLPLRLASEFFGTGQTLYLVPEFFGAFAV